MQFVLTGNDKKIMHRKFIFVILSLVTFSTLSQTIKLSEKERQEVRQTNLEIAKRTCIAFFDATEKRQLLFKLGIALDDQCKCTQEAVGYLVSDDLAAYASHALYEVRKNGVENINPTLRDKLEEHNQLVMTAMQGCSNKLKR